MPAACQSTPTPRPGVGWCASATLCPHRIDLAPRPGNPEESIPVTFTFGEAGEVTVDAVVAAEGQDPGADVDFPDPDEDPTDP